MLDLLDVLRMIDEHEAATGEKPAQLSRRATGSPDTIRNWKRAVAAGKTPGASTRTLQAIAEAIGSAVSIDGARNGSRLVSSFDPDAEESFEDADSASYSREHWVPAVDGALPEVDTKLGAGSGVVGQTINLPVGGSSVSGHPVIAEWLIPLQYLRNEAKASPNHTLVMEVIGDSMQPTYMPGDRVLVDLSQNAMSTDTVYAISDGQSEPQIKRLQRVPFSEPIEVRIISDNPNLERFTVELERLTIIGRIVGHIARK